MSGPSWRAVACVAHSPPPSSPSPAPRSPSRPRLEHLPWNSSPRRPPGTPAAHHGHERPGARHVELHVPRHLPGGCAGARSPGVPGRAHSAVPRRARTGRARQPRHLGQLPQQAHGAEGHDSAWSEADYYASVTATLGRWSPGVVTTAITSPNAAFGTVYEVGASLDFDDSGNRVPLAPRVFFVAELSGQADAGATPGRYLEVSMRPTRTLRRSGRATGVSPSPPAPDFRCAAIASPESTTLGFALAGLLPSVTLSGARVALELHAGLELMRLAPAPVCSTAAGTIAPSSPPGPASPTEIEGRSRHAPLQLADPHPEARSALAVFGLLPAILIAWTTYQTASQAMTDDVGKAFTQSAVALNDTIDRNLFERYGDVQAFGVNDAIFDRASWLSRAPPPTTWPGSPTPTWRSTGIYTLSVVVDLEGRVIAVNDRDAAARTSTRRGCRAALLERARVVQGRPGRPLPDAAGPGPRRAPRCRTSSTTPTPSAPTAAAAASSRSPHRCGTRKARSSRSGTTAPPSRSWRTW